MNPTLGIFLKLASVTAFVAMQALVKGTEGRVPPGEVVFFRSLFALPVIVVWLAWQRQLRVGLTTAYPIGHFWRGVAGTAAMGCVFASLQLLPLPEATALFYAAPILTVVFAALFLGEEVRLFRMAAVGLGMIGVLVVLAPRLTAFSQGQFEAAQTLGALLMLSGASLAALAQIFIRKLVATERSATIVLYFTLSSIVLSLVTVPFGWVMPTRGDALLLIGAGVFGGAAQGLLTSAYRFAPASVVAPFEYASMLLAVAVGLFIFSEVPSGPTLIGASLIVAAGVLIIWRERQLGLRRDKLRKAMTHQG